MKLTTARVERTLHQFQAQAISDSRPLHTRAEFVCSAITPFFSMTMGCTLWSRYPPRTASLQGIFEVGELAGPFPHQPSCTQAPADRRDRAWL